MFSLLRLVLKINLKNCCTEMGGCVSSWTINAFGGTKRIDAKNNFDGEYD